MKVRLYFILCNIVLFSAYGQVTFFETWNSYTLQTYSTTTGVWSYTLPHSGWKVFSDSYGNAAGPSYNPNAPFHDPLLKNQSFVIYRDPVDQDTILVSTSWIDSSKYAVDRWIISPAISVTQPWSAFSWNARSPDPQHRDGYELYVFPSTLTITHPSQITQSFTPVFSIPDNHTSGGGEFPHWMQRSVDVSSYYLQGFRFAFRHTSKNRYQLWLDDFRLTHVPFPVNASLLYYVGMRCLPAGSSDTLRVRLRNLSVSSLSMVSLAYQVNQSSPVIQTFSLTSPLYFKNEKTFSFTVPYFFSASGTYTIKTWIQSLNGQPDQDPSDDTLYTLIYVPVQPIARKALVEIGMSAANPMVPKTMEFLSGCLPSSAIPLCYHFSDSLEKTYTSLWKNRFQTTVTHFVHNRRYRFDHNYYRYESQQLCSSLPGSGTVAPVSLTFSSVHYDSASRVVQATLEVTSGAPLFGDFRIHVFLSENQISSVAGTSFYDGFNQQNGFYTVPGSPWFSKGTWDPLVGQYVMNAWQYKHHHVLRNILTPWSGLTGIIPGNGTSLNQTYSLAITCTIPPVPSYAVINQAENIYLTAAVEEFFSDSLKNIIWNVTRSKIWNKQEIVGMKKRSSFYGKTEVFPIPFQEFLMVRSDIPARDFRLISADTRNMYSLSWVLEDRDEEIFLFRVVIKESVPDGIYILEMVSEDASRRFVKVIKIGR